MAQDAMEFINDQDQVTLQRFVERLEARGTDPTFTGYRDAYLSELKLPDSADVLEIGCGTGVVARAVAARPGFTGRVIATDQSPALLDAGRALAQAEGVAEHIEFRACDAHALPFPDGAFDALIAHTVVSHVTDPLAVLREAARVIRADGLIAVFDGDYASLAFGSRDGALGREMVEAILAVIVSKPQVLRDLPVLLRVAGLRLVAAQPHVYAEIGTSRFFLGMAEAYAPLVVREKLLEPERVEAWLDGLRTAAAEETFFGSCNYYTYILHA